MEIAEVEMKKGLAVAGGIADFEGSRRVLAIDGDLSADHDGGVRINDFDVTIGRESAKGRHREKRENEE